MYRHCLQAMAEPLVAEPRAAFALSASAYWPGGPCPMLLTPRWRTSASSWVPGCSISARGARCFAPKFSASLADFRWQALASDYLFWLDACTKVNALLVPGNLFYYRVHAGQELASPKSALALRAVGSAPPGRC